MTKRQPNVDNILGWSAPHIHFSAAALKAQDTTNAPPATIRMRRNELGGWERAEA